MVTHIQRTCMRLLTRSTSSMSHTHACMTTAADWHRWRLSTSRGMPTDSTTLDGTILVPGMHSSHAVSFKSKGPWVGHRWKRNLQRGLPRVSPGAASRLASLRFVSHWLLCFDLASLFCYNEGAVRIAGTMRHEQIDKEASRKRTITGSMEQAVMPPPFSRRK